MPKGIGRQYSVGFAKEAVRGTAESAATFWFQFSDATVDDKDSRVTYMESIGAIEDSDSTAITKQWADIKAKGPITDKTIGLILLAALGSVTTTTNADASTTVKDHTFSVAQSCQHQSLTTFLDDPLGAQDYKHALSMVDKMTITYELGKLVEVDLALRAKKGVTATLTPSVTAENRFLPQHLTFKLAANLAGLTGASATVIKSLKLEISKNLEDDEVLGSLSPADFLNKQFSIEGEIEAMWQNESDFKTAVLAGTFKAMRIDIKNTDVTIGTAANPQLKIDLAKVALTELTRPIKVNDTIRQTIKFKAHYSITDTKMVSVVLTNLQASY